MLRVVEHAAFTDTGRQRRANEDALLSRSPLFAVADGMGGAKAGEIASRTAIDVVGLGVEDGVVRSRIVELIRRANRTVHEAQVADPELGGMGTTVTVAHVGERALTVAHVGDSRAYLLRGGALRRLTDDHSLVEEMRRSGRLTAEEAENHPQRSIITRALGPEPTVEIDVREFELERGDVVLLCSDGLTTMLPEGRIAEILAQGPTLDQAGRALVRAANDAGGRDNITVVLLRIGDGSDPFAGDEDETVAGPAGEGSPGDTAILPTVDPSAVAPSGAAGAPPGPRGDRRRRRPRRRGKAAAATLATLFVVVGILFAGWSATRVTYFIGTDEGYVAIYQGAPYAGPFGLRLYKPIYRSGVPLASVAPARRASLLDHRLRTGEDARDLIRAVERDELAQTP